MKLFIHILSYFLIGLSVISCKSQKQRFQPMADSIKNYFSRNIPNANSIDTIYLMVDTVTQRKQTIFQAAEYDYAATMAGRMHNSDSTLLRDTADKLMRETSLKNDSKFLFYSAMPLVAFTKKNDQKSMAEKWLFFDKNFKLIPKYSFLKKVKVATKKVVEVRTKKVVEVRTKRFLGLSCSNNKL